MNSATDDHCREAVKAEEVTDVERLSAVADEQVADP